MKRRTLIQGLAVVAALPLRAVRLIAQPKQLTPEAVALLHEIAPVVLPSTLGTARTRAVVEKLVVWVRDYHEGIALAHGYGHPLLRKSGPTPAPAYIAQLAAIDREARSQGGRWSTLDRDRQRAILDAAFTAAGVRNLPPRPMGQHVVADLMATYFRSSEANDDCYRAAIGRETCRAIPVTVRKPDAI